MRCGLSEELGSRSGARIAIPRSNLRNQLSGPQHPYHRLTRRTRPTPGWPRAGHRQVA